MKLILKVLFGVLIITSCTKDKVEPPIIHTYLHISHTRTEVNPEIIEEANSINYSDFDLIMHGGDIATMTSADGSSMSQLNDIFNFGDPNTLWSIGNHDITFPNLVSSYTQRPLFFSYEKNGITYIVLDTETDSCKIINEQKSLFNTITDTIQSSSHLIILHHKLVWMNNHSIYNSQINTISNAPSGECEGCLRQNNFMNELYPKLVEVQNIGVQVICIGGDIGNHVQEFEYQDSEGIFFLASGFNMDIENNKVLEFKHNLSQGTLNWEFIEVSKL